ncbi:MAG: hypothetical protein VYB45_04115, partial [Pseudomonadota bacterium]|nr:hypothetical protein [Pseudomonadota bacterium]
VSVGRPKPVVPEQAGWFVPAETQSRRPPTATELLSRLNSYPTWQHLRINSSYTWNNQNYGEHPAKCGHLSPTSLNACTLI